MYGVTFTKKIYHEGDERSKRSPGHGYPAYTETFTEFKEIDNEEALKKWITDHEGR